MLMLKVFFFYNYEFFKVCGVIDYLEISKEFYIVILENIFKMILFNKIEVRRFIILVDIFYDNKVCVNLFFFIFLEYLKFRGIVFCKK